MLISADKDEEEEGRCVTLPLPRLASSTVERERVSAWLTRNARTPLRFLLAPAGSGKTTALVRYAQSREKASYYVHLKHRTDERLLETNLCELFALGTFTYPALLAALNCLEYVELIVDGIDRLHVTEQALLERLVHEIPAHVSLVYAGTTTCLAVHSLEAAGLAVVLPREELLFQQSEIGQLGAHLGLVDEQDSFEQIRDTSDGWPIVVADILRCAAEHGTSAVDGYERWVTHRSRSFTAYLQDEISRFSEVGKVAFEKAMRREEVSNTQLTILEDIGAFVAISNGNIRPYKVVSDLLSVETPVHTSRTDPVNIRMFGRFSVRSGDREVTWIRRRDQQIFRYIAVRPSGRVKKSEIIDIFWPDADSHLAAQSLRTACSNIRKALSSILDMATVEQLFVTEGQELYINFNKTVIDVRRFKSHIGEASGAESEGRIADAMAHFRAAERIYRADLFSGEPEESWFLPQREVYRDMSLLARERIGMLGAELSNVESHNEEIFVENRTSALP